ncbi:MAG: hypothetical protein QM706_16525 [Nitrospira sp.]
MSAIQADPNLAEARFHLGLALNQLNLQSDTTKPVKTSTEPAPAQQAIIPSYAYPSDTASSSPSIYRSRDSGEMGEHSSMAR